MKKLRLGFKIYREVRGERSAAELAYYLTLSLFPLLICLNALLPAFNLSSRDVLKWGSGIAPATVLRLFAEYTDYISGQNTTAMLIGAVTLMLISGSAAFRAITGVSRQILLVEMCDERNRGGILRGILRYGLSFVFAIGFLLAIYLASIVIVADGMLPDTLLPPLLRSLLRYAVLFVILLTMVWGVYLSAAPKRKHFKGAVASAAALYGIGILFSRTIELSTNYSLVYGSLAALVLLMIWLSLCGNVLVCGCIVNRVLNGEMPDCDANTTRR
jgi:membrane protein